MTMVMPQFGSVIDSVSYPPQRTSRSYLPRAERDVSGQQAFALDPQSYVSIKTRRVNID